MGPHHLFESVPNFSEGTRAEILAELDGASLGDAHELPLSLGDRVWNELKVPVYYYGHGEEHTLADIRAGRVRASLGDELHVSAGAVCIGARHPLVAFNVILPGLRLLEARALARALRESGGGLRGVQALAFELTDGRVQLSMNLFRLDETPPSAVVAELERRGVSIGS